MSLCVQEGEVDVRYLEIYWENHLVDRLCKPLFFGRLKTLSSCQSMQECQEAIQKIETHLVKSEVLRMLARKSYFSDEIRQKLHLKGFSERAIAYALEVALKGGFSDDSQKTQRLIEREQRKGYGAQSIIFKLKQKKIPAEDLQLLKGNMVLEEKKSLQELLQKKYSRVDWKDPVSKRRALAQLQRRGFSFESIREAISIGNNLDSEYTENN